MSTAQKTIDYICDLWGGDRYIIPEKYKWVDNPAFTTREGLENQAQYLKSGGTLYAFVKNERKHSGIPVIDVGKKAENIVLKSFIIE